VSVLLPDRKYKGLWHRILHDKTADSILQQVSRLPHANVTTVPFHLDTAGQAKVPLSTLVSRRRSDGGAGRHIATPAPLEERDAVVEELAPDVTPISDVAWRSHVRIAGRVRSVRVAALHDAPTLEVVLVDGTGGISVVFLGRRGIAGVKVGTKMVVEGTVGVHKARLALLNPTYRLL
jgi:hypothetical protein